MTTFSRTFGSTFADLVAGARDGLAIEARYRALSQRSTPDLAKLGLTRADIAQAALRGF
jgi:hypothetical protein